MKHHRVVVTRHGGPDVLQVVEEDRPEPRAGEVRVKVLTAGVSAYDLMFRRSGLLPGTPRVPFTLGVDIVGVVDKLGEEVSTVEPGQTVAGATFCLGVGGGYAEFICLPASELVPVPSGVDPAEAVCVVVNYLTAHMAMHRTANIRGGERILVHGAAGGVGTALLELGKLAGLEMYGLASKSKHGILTQYGATPIDYRTQDFVEVLRQAEPDGIDYVFNGMAGEIFERGLAVLRRGGVLVHYGGPQSFGGFLSLVAKLIGYNVLPNGKSIKGYGTHRVDHQLLAEDWSALFDLLEGGKIQPVIAKTFPILEAAQANALLESGQVTGNIVLLAPELM